MFSSSGSFDSTPEKESLEMKLGLRVIKEQESLIRLHEKQGHLSTLHMTQQSFMKKTGAAPLKKLPIQLKKFQEIKIINKSMAGNFDPAHRSSSI